MRIIVRLSVTAAIIIASAAGAIQWSLSGGAADEQLIRQWLGEHPSPSQDLNTFRELSLTFKKGVLARITARERAEVWKAHLTDYFNKGTLPASLYGRAVSYLEAAAVKTGEIDDDTNRELQQLAADADATLGKSLTAEIFGFKGARDGTLPVATGLLRLKLAIRSAVVTHASAPEFCDCTGGWDTRCTNPQFCDAPGQAFCEWVENNCGFLYQYTCDGLCINKPDEEGK